MASMSDVAAIAKALFGDLVDPDALVGKMDPGPSDVHSYGGSNRAVLIPKRTGKRRLVSERTQFGGGRSNSERVQFGAGRNSERTRFGKSTGHKILAGTGLLATGLGAAFGAKELKTAVPEAKGLWRAKQGWLVKPAAGAKGLAAIPRPGPAARVAGVAGMLGGDAIATGEQTSGVKSRKDQQALSKAVPMGDLVRGILGNSRTMSAVHAPNVVHDVQASQGSYRRAAKQTAQRDRAVRQTGNRWQHSQNDAVRQTAQRYGGGQQASQRLTELRARKVQRATGTGGHIAPVGGATPKPKPTGQERAMQIGQGIRRDVGNLASTTSGKVALGAGGLLAARHVAANRGGGGSPVPPYDPYVGKAARRDDVTFSGTFSKFDDDRRLAFGWANVSKINGLPVVDRQGDYVSIEDIEDAAYTYVMNSRIGGDMHKRIGGKADGTGDRPHHVADLVESMVFDDAKVETLGLPDDFPRGWWVGFRVFDDDVWDMAKDGRRSGFSIHGKGIRKSVDYDELMGTR